MSILIQQKAKQLEITGPAGWAQRGMSLLEVLIGIIIFAIGMLALASLQGSLTRSAADANARSVAVNLAETLIERKRGFARIETDPLGVFPAYADIVDNEIITETHGGIDFTITTSVADYYYDLDTDSFTMTVPVNVIYSDYKRLTVTVDWDALGFRSGTNTPDIAASALGTGSVVLTDTISSLTSAFSSKAVTQEDSDLNFPPVSYTPGANPDIVALGLGNNKFKEALTPQPDVIRLGELVETRFDVITYSQNAGTQFVRREEFAAVSCDCRLKAAPANAEDAGRRPTLWAGDEYVEPEFVAKPYGESATNIQSPLCDACCQDHHDGGTGTNDPVGDPSATLYDAYRNGADFWYSGTFTGDHIHYKRSHKGVISIADQVDDVYVEACKMVRKDGFFRVAQDFRREGLNVFPYDFLDETAEVNAYSAYVTGAVGSFANATHNNYEQSPPSLAAPSRTPEGINPPPTDDLTLDYTFLPTALSVETQQLRSRGIYIDYLSEDLRTVLTCINGGGDASTCKTGDVELDVTGSANVLEILPFFELQMTYLNRWKEVPANDPVDTTNEALETGNTHSRGVASKTGSVGVSVVVAHGHKGVLGLTDTDPIDLKFNLHTTENQMKVIVSNSNPPTPNGVLVTGEIVSGVPGLQAASVEIEWAEKLVCDRTPNGFTCLVKLGGSEALLTVTNYEKQNRNIVACSTGLPTNSSGTDVDNSPFTSFDLAAALDSIYYVISIEEDSCG